MRRIALILAVAAAGTVFAWPWLTRSPEERAAMRLVAASGGRYPMRPAIADCPRETYERLRREFRKAVPDLKEATDLITAIDDATTVALLHGDQAAVALLRAQAPDGGGVLVGACDGERVHLAAVAADGDIKDRVDLPLADAGSQRTARLHVVTRPAGAGVWLDGKPIGTTPLLAADLPPGPRRLRLRDPRFTAIKEDLTLSPGALVRRQYVMQRGSGNLAVVSRPSGAAIFVDGAPWPRATPSLVGPLPSGSHKIELRAAGFPAVRAEAEVPTEGTSEIKLAFPGAPPEIPGRVWREPRTGMEMVWVPPGCFRRGCGPWTQDCDPDEALGRNVCVSGFWMGRHEVTQSQWQRVMGSDPSSGQRGADRPVNEVSWHAARAFAARLGPGFRLPTEAEWEYACRSGGQAELYAGATLKDDHLGGAGYVSNFAWIGRRWDEGPFPVGKKKPNGLGIFDMSGNVWEWMEDSFHQRAYAEAPPDNPLVSGTGPQRVVRGGSWFNFARLARCSHRDKFDANFANVDLGLRIVRAAPDTEMRPLRKVEVRR